MLKKQKGITCFFMRVITRKNYVKKTKGYNPN